MNKEKVLEHFVGVRNGLISTSDLDKPIRELKHEILQDCCTPSGKKALKVLSDIISNAKNERLRNTIYHAPATDSYPEMYTFTDSYIAIGIYENNPFEGSDLFEIQDRNLMSKLLDHAQQTKVVPFAYVDVCNHIKIQRANHKALGEKMKDFIPLVLIGDRPINLNHLKMIMDAFQKNEIELQLGEKALAVVSTDQGVALTCAIQYNKESFDRKRYWEYEEK